MCTGAILRGCCLFALCIGLLLPCARPAAAVSPIVDPSTSATTSTWEDPDLIIHRELYYGAGGVDLSGLHLVTAAGPTSFVTRGPDPGANETYVQSLLVRLYAPNDRDLCSVVEGSIVLPASVNVRGVITAVIDNPTYAWVDPALANDLPNSDALFALTDLTGLERQLQTGGPSAPSYDYVQVSGSTVSFRLGTGQHGIDDFRILLDYGCEPAYGLTFSVTLLDGVFEGWDRSGGLVLGDTDCGEGLSFTGLELTPVPEPAMLMVVAAGALWFLRRKRKS